MKCPHCQAENPEGVKFCGECGKSLSIKLTCPKCGYKNPQGIRFCHECGHTLTEQAPISPKPKSKKPSPPEPTSFADGRYQVKKFLGEGGKKKVYLAHDTLLDRDVAFALIKTEKLDEVARTRITREAQAMGKLGDHPHIVTIYDIGEHEGQPYIVQPALPGGDVEGLIEKAPEHRLPLDKAIEITKAVCQGLELAHSRGIIHRDIKPGNVMLSGNGTAKINDFGLAIAVDLSRLTQSGMMVGTVSYMPPEQAMGGKVTAQADLYSLGAMLYEMVTGRPPFVGDDSVSIIGQHINTPPVSPTWHRADLPPSLETLILQLLEKDPAKRPSSAADVLQALESIDAGKVSKEVLKEASKTDENPLYRRVFVGREAELKQLQAAFDGALSGKGALMMVMGEPGIGKTALCEQMTTYVTLRGGRTLVGHCYEEGSLSLPYLAFVEALRSYVLSREPKDLREELGTGAADVARIVSEIRQRLKIKPRPSGGDPEEARYRLLQAVTGFLSNTASVQPLMIVLEDLHDADKGTLDMLTHVSRHLVGTRLLVVGTYRDVEVDRSHPLSAALAELRRLSSYGRVILHGLNADEVRRMLESIAQEEIPWGLAEAVHRQTEGNPLFVQEVVRYLAEEGLITQKEGRWRPTKDTPLEMNIPEGLRDVIGKRLSLLSKECNQLLSVAAVIGREFPLDTLRGVAGIKEETFVEALKEAVQMSVLEERSQVGIVRYRFTHAFFRQTLYEELIAPRRLQLHQQVARSLETQYAKRLEEHAAELAEHFSQSTDPVDLVKAVDYGEMAAKRATAVYAYGEAVRLLEQALKVQRVLDPDDRARICDLLLDLSEVLWATGEARHALDEELPEAFSLAEAIGDSLRLSRSCTLAIKNYSLIASFSQEVWSRPEAALWLERADRCAEPETVGRAWSDMGNGLVKSLMGYFSQQPGMMKEGVKLLDRSLELALRLDDYETFWYIPTMWLTFTGAPRHTERRQKLVEELADRLSECTNAVTLSIIGMALLEYGRRHRYEECCKQLKGMAERQSTALLTSMRADSVLDVLDGRLEEALEISQSSETLGKELGIPEFATLNAQLIKSTPLIRLGRTDELLQAALMVPASLVRVASQGKPASDAEASEMLEKQVVQRPGIGTDDDETGVTLDTMYLEVAVLVGHRPSAELLLSRLASNSCRMLVGAFSTCIARHLGGAGALLERYEEARKYYQEAIELCTAIRFRPELALTRLQLAELLLEHYSKEKKEALEHLDFAIKEFREMKMQPSLERALRHKDILKA
jgi:tetratricopeptide (TPR) repeat protein/archaellum biogenesis ATPase FlaH